MKITADEFKPFLETDVERCAAVVAAQNYLDMGYNRDDSIKFAVYAMRLAKHAAERKQEQRKRFRLTKQDWGLIYEAIDMLLMDYTTNPHPCEERLNELQDIASYRSERRRRRRPVSARIAALKRTV